MSPHAVRSRITRLAFCLLGIMFLGCGDPSLSASTRSDAGQEEKPPAPVRLQFVSLPTRVEAGAAFDTPVQVALFREDGKVDTTWTGAVHISLGMNASIAELEGPLSATAVDGVAMFEGLSVTHAATGYTIRAVADGFETVESLAFTVTPAPATTVEFITQPSALTAGQVFDPPIEIELRDSFGNPVTRTTTLVTLSLLVDGETPPDVLDGTTSITPVLGRALFADVSSTRAGKGLRLLVSAGEVSETSRRFDVTADVPARLAVKQQPGNVVAGGLFPPLFSFVVEDQFGNRTPGDFGRNVSITLKVGSPLAKLNGSTTVATADGVAVFSQVGMTMAGTDYVIEASSGALTSAVTSPFNVVAGSPDHMNVLTVPTDTVAGRLYTPPVTVGVLDIYDNIAPTATDDVVVTLLGRGDVVAALNGTTQVTPVDGIAVYADLNIPKSTKPPSEYYLMSFSSGPFPKIRTPTFFVAPAEPAVMTLSGPPLNSTVGNPLIVQAGIDSAPTSLQAVVRDRFGNLTDLAVPVSVTLHGGPPGAHLSGAVAATTAGGTAVFPDLTIDIVGTGYGLTFTAPNLPTVESDPFGIHQLSLNDSLSAGPNHTCAMNPDLSIFCWGSNSVGQVRNGIAGAGVYTPLPVTERGAWKSVVGAATNTTCGLRLDNTLWCRGQNTGGVFGDGTFVNANTWIQEWKNSAWSSVATGGFHACGLKTDGTLWCWGAGALGQRADGTSGASAIATSTPAQVQSGPTWRSISAGLNHTCGIKPDGSLWCWGEGVDGQLGTGSTVLSNVAVRESSSATWLSVDCGDRHTCGIQTDGSLWCWGLNDSGQLGDGTRTSHSAPVRESSASTWKSVSGGGAHTCGIKTDGSLWCWGASAAGQIGDGKAQTDNPNPVREISGATWTRVVTGASHTCGLKADRSIWCWGSNTNGQLGIGSTPQSTSEPTRIAPGAASGVGASWGP